ncbi:exodeoxyribonuclease VII small subunit [Clostridium malenominatum]|uniref:Exodeoxyribonuclease 7 small subunit n=1 Tax=Clostridium malenominatum TaxID=1539 RepID=A0ABN1IYE5_9CLOT
MAKKIESYENILKKLETIVETMDKEELALEASMKNYEEGIALCNKLYKILNEAEGKIKILTENIERDFQVEEI